MAKKHHLSKFAGTLTKEEGEELKRHIKELREKMNKEMEERSKRIAEALDKGGLDNLKLLLKCLRARRSRRYLGKEAHAWHAVNF